MTLATKDDLLRPTKRRFKEVTLPVSGLTVRIRSLTQLDRERYEVAIMEGAKIRSDADRILMAHCLVDGDGNRLLDDTDVKALRDLDCKDAATLNRACVEWNGLSSYDVEQLLGNSGRVADVGSESALPSPAADSTTSTDS